MENPDILRNYVEVLISTIFTYVTGLIWGENASRTFFRLVRQSCHAEPVRHPTRAVRGGCNYRRD